MTQALWSDRYATGIEIVDRQHQQLFSSINQLDAALKRQDPAEGIRKSLAFLVDYTQDHFRTEEDLMRRAAYPEIAAHETEHAALLVRVKELKRRFEAGEPVGEELAGFMADWLNHHIREVDQAWVATLRPQARS